MSTLLEQASLVMIPSGYKEDVVYSQIPTSGAGDLSFTRASNGTRINSAGLVEVCPWNLLQQSETFENASWLKFDASATANATTAPNGTTTADKFVEGTGSSIHRFNQGLSIDSGQSYTFSVYAKASERTRILLRTNNGSADQDTYFDLTNGTIISGTGTIESVGNGWYKVSRSLTATTSVSSNFITQLLLVNTGTNTSYTGDGTSGLFVYGAQLNIGSTAKPYFPTTDRLNVPRLTYQNGGGGCPSLLLEKQSTNYVLQSEDFSDAIYKKNSGGGGSTPIVTANYGISPDGTQNADRIQLQRTTATGSYSQVNQDLTLTNGTVYTVSVYLKSLSGTPTIYLTYDGTNFLNAVTLTSEWVRYTAQFTATTTSTDFFQFLIYENLPSSSLSADFLAWGAQVEASSYSTSYIKTTSSSATRVADACFKTGISSLIGQTEGVWFLDFTYVYNGASYQSFMIHDNVTLSNFVYMYRSGTNTLNFYVKSILIGTYSITNNTRYKIAFAYKSGNHAIYINGTAIATSGNSAAPSALNSLRCSYTDGGEQLQCPVNQILLFPTRLTNAELASLTTI